MKKFLRFSAAAAAALITLVSCQRSELLEIFSGPKTKVTIGARPEEAEEATRTYIEEDASAPGTYHSKWSNSCEALGVIFGDISESSQCTVLSADETTDNDPVFTGELSLDDGTYNMFLFYPSSAYSKCYKPVDEETEGTVGLVLNNVQHPELGTFDPSCDLMGWSSNNIVVENSSLILENIHLSRPMAILRLALNAGDDAIASGMTVTGVKMEVAAGASASEAVVLTGLMKMSRLGTVTKWNTAYSYVEAEIDPSECITVGEAGFNEVFLIVNAATIPAGRKIYFTVDGKDATGGDLQFRREVSKDSEDITFQAGKLNTIALKLRDKDLVQETGEFYEKVTCLDDLVEGDYLIVYEGNETHDAVAFNGGLTALDAASNGLAVTISDNKIASTTTLDAAVFTISPDDGTILSKSGLYIGVSSNSNGLKTSEDASAYKNTFEFDENGNANILADFEGSTMKLRYNYASDQMRFRYFKTDQQPIALYASPYNVVDTTPRITFADDENGRVEKTVPASTTTVEFVYSKNRYVTELPTATKYSGLYLFDGDPVVTDGKVTVTILPSTEETPRRIIVKMTGQGISDEGVFLEIVQEAYVPGPTLVGDGTAENPYTASDIWTVYPTEGSGDTQVYVTGTVSEITEVSTQHGNATYTITDGDKSILVYRGKYIDNVNFTAEDQIAVGDVAVIYGKISIYNSAPQLAQGNYLISLVPDPDRASLSVNPASLSWAAAETNAQTVTVTVNGNATGYTVSPSTDANWNISDNGQGTVTVSPKAANTSTTAEKTLTLTIAHKDDNTLSKTVVCTQAKDAAVTVANFLDGGAKTYAGTTGNILVYHVNGSAAIVGDSSGKMLLYKSGHGYSAGDLFTVTSAVIAEYNGYLELTGGTFNKVSSGNPVDHGTPVNLSNQSAATSLQSTFSASGFHSATFVSLSGAKSGRNINGEYAKLYLNSNNTDCDGQTVLTTGYVFSYSSSHGNYNYQMVSVEEDTTTPRLSVNPTSLTWNADEYGVSCAKEFTLTINPASAGFHIDHMNDWAIESVNASTGLYKAWPKAENTSTTNAKTETITFTHVSDENVTASITMTQNKVGSGGDPVLKYTLDGTITGGTNGYATDSEITQSNISWIVTANTTMNPWRFGGKSLTNENRAAYSTTAITSNISSVEVESGSATATVNSLTISVHNSASDAAGGSNPIATKTVTSGITGAKVTLTKTDATSWAGKYYRIVYNVSAGGSNQYVQFKSAKFYGN